MLIIIRGNNFLFTEIKMSALSERNRAQLVSILLFWSSEENFKFEEFDALTNSLCQSLTETDSNVSELMLNLTDRYGIDLTCTKNWINTLDVRIKDENAFDVKLIELLCKKNNSDAILILNKSLDKCQNENVRCLLSCYS